MKEKEITNKQPGIGPRGESKGFRVDEGKDGLLVLHHNKEALSKEQLEFIRRLIDDFEKEDQH